MVGKEWFPCMALPLGQLKPCSDFVVCYRAFGMKPEVQGLFQSVGVYSLIIECNYEFSVQSSEKDCDACVLFAL